MINLKIDPEFQSQIPPLTDDEFKQLEENILKEGKLLSPLIVWNNTLVDGHSRYAILQKHPEIYFSTMPLRFENREEAIAWICRNQLGRRNLSPEQKRYLLGKQYEAEKKAAKIFRGIAPTTQESYKYCLKMLKEGFYHRPLTVIRPIDIENFLKGMRRDGRSDSYISKARGMLYQIFQKAEANDLVRRNPVRLAEKMRASGTAKRKEAFTTAEVAHLMKVLPDDRMGLSIRLLLGTGMRMQELLALEPQFIEEDGSVIHIRQAVKVVKGTVSIGSPKSKDSIRDIPVPLNVRKCAIKLRDTTDQFIWESPKTGLPCNPTHFRDVFRKSLEEAGDVRLLTPHSCRHTYVSQMQALGVDIQTIQSIVGHADTEMTEHYLHVQESIRQSAIQLFSEAFSA